MKRRRMPPPPNRILPLCNHVSLCVFFFLFPCQRCVGLGLLFFSTAEWLADVLQILTVDMQMYTDVLGLVHKSIDFINLQIISMRADFHRNQRLGTECSRLYRAETNQSCRSFLQWGNLAVLGRGMPQTRTSTVSVDLRGWVWLSAVSYWGSIDQSPNFDRDRRNT